MPFVQKSSRPSLPGPPSRGTDDYLTQHVPPGQFFRYLLIGGWNTVFGYSLYVLFTALLLPRIRYGYILASALSNLLSITVAYFGYKIFVFKTHGNYFFEWLRCLVVYGSGTILDFFCFLCW